MIYLLDLNYTLAEKVSINFQNFTYDVSKDKYRNDLVQKLKNERVFLITARTENYKDETIEKIKKETDLQIERFYFKPLNKKFQKVEFFKSDIVKQLFLEGFNPEDFFGIESNVNTRNEYLKLNVKSLDYKNFMKEELCQTQQTKLF